MWENHPRFNSIIKDGWQAHFYGTEQYKHCKKLKLLKYPLKKLNIKEFSHISTRAATLRNHLEELQIQLQGDLDNHDL